MHKLLFVVAAALLSSACSTTKLIDHWQSPGFSRADLDKILIVAVTDNPTNRFLFETEFEREMVNDGVAAATSFREIGDAFPTRENVKAYLETHNYDHVVATRVESIETEKDYVPPQVRTYYTGPYYPTFDHYYGGYYGGNVITMRKEGYVDERNTVHLVTTIFDVKRNEPVWIGRSATFEPGAVVYLAEEIARSMWRDIAH